MATKEIWKACTDYPGFFVSNLGRVKKGKNILKQIQEPQGYMRVYSPKGPVRVHSLVAKAFLPTVSGKSQVDHKNDIKTDNRACNLQWVTSGENTAKAGRAGKLSRPVKSISIVAVNMETFEVHHFGSQSDAERVLGIDNRNINSCLKKRRLITHNYKFYYEREWRKL